MEACFLQPTITRAFVDSTIRFYREDPRNIELRLTASCSFMIATSLGLIETITYLAVATFSALGVVFSLGCWGIPKRETSRFFTLAKGSYVAFFLAISGIFSPKKASNRVTDIEKHLIAKVQRTAFSALCYLSDFLNSQQKKNSDPSLLSCQQADTLLTQTKNQVEQQIENFRRDPSKYLSLKMTQRNITQMVKNALGAIRTRDLLLRRQPLYPAELRGLI